VVVSELQGQSKQQWARLGAVAVLVIGLAIVGLLALSRHDRAVTARVFELERGRQTARQRLERERQVTRLLARYLEIPVTDWERRDQALMLVGERTADPSLKKWAAARRKEIAPYLRRIRLVQRYNAASDKIAVTAVPEPSAAATPQPAAPAQQPADAGKAAAAAPAFADEGEALAKARKSPHWKEYIKTREQLRLKRGRYCCRITTGRELFSKADSVAECRGYAQLLCDLLAKMIDAEQKSLYALSTACAGGEIIGAGDVSSSPE